MTLLATDPRPCSVYRWYAPGGQLLYVGAALDPERRWAVTQTAEDWPRLAARRCVEWYETVGLALSAEMDAIRTESPLLNINGVSGRRHHAEVLRELPLDVGIVVPLLRVPTSISSRWLVGDEMVDAYWDAKGGVGLVWGEPSAPDELEVARRFKAWLGQRRYGRIRP